MHSHVSDLVISLAGRDRDGVFLVLREEEDFLWLANGRGRRAEKPKRKKRKHTAFAGHCDARTREKTARDGQADQQRYPEGPVHLGGGQPKH